MSDVSTIGQEPLEVSKPDTDDLSLWSVTTIIGVLDKPALLYWAAEQTANAAIDSVNTWQAMAEDEGRDAAVKWLRDARNRRPKDRLSDAALGTVVHKMCETYALTGVRPDRVFAEQIVADAFQSSVTQDAVDAEVHTAGLMLNQFDGWLQRAQPSYQATEVCVYSPLYGYAGQCDAFLTVDRVRFIADYKSSRKPRDSRGQLKRPYAESVALQLAAYRQAEYAAVWRPRRMEKFKRRYYLLSEAERELAVPVPEVDTGLVIQITPEHCESHPIECGPDVHRAFLYCIEAFRWKEELSKTVMGPPLEFPERTA